MMKKLIYCIVFLLFILILVMLGILGYADGVEEQIVDEVAAIEQVDKGDIESVKRLNYSDDCLFGALIEVKGDKETYLFCREKGAEIYLESIGHDHDQYYHMNQLYKEPVMQQK